MDETLTGYFNELDRHLKNLGQSDSSIEYAPHIREEFDKVVKSLNNIKGYLGGIEMLYKSDKYFNE